MATKIPSKYKNPRYKALIHSQRWRALRLQHLKQYPLCEGCKAKGLVTPATEVHHVLPIERAPSLEEMEARAYNTRNLQSLCRACHREAHAKRETPATQAKQLRQARLNHSNGAFLSFE